MGDIQKNPSYAQHTFERNPSTVQPAAEKKDPDEEEMYYQDMNGETMKDIGDATNAIYESLYVTIQYALACFAIVNRPDELPPVDIQMSCS